MKKFYITTTLPYVNAEPHIGFALEIVQADSIARYKKLLGLDVFFNFGTDEHGLKIYRKAQENNQDPIEYCNEYARKFDNLKKALNLSYNSFVRTTDKHHVLAAQEFWTRCQKNGDIYKKPYKTKYCVGCELEKTASDLKKGRCPLHPNTELLTIDEENYFFRFSKYQQKLLEFYKHNPNFIVPKSRLNEIKEFVSGGLNDFSVSRLKEKMPWGIDVPGDSSHVMYVWFDALINYISALGWPENNQKFESFWPGLQVAGKDNLRQQSAIWQAMLMSANLPNSKQIYIHGFISANGEKMSKSLGNVVDPYNLVDKYSTDAVRYYLLAHIHPWRDSDFTYKKFENAYNSNLANGLGNLTARIAKLASQTDNLKLNHALSYPEALHNHLAYKKYFESFRFDKALTYVWTLIKKSDLYINKNEPWRRDGTEKTEIVTKVISDIREISTLLLPCLPETGEKILKQFSDTPIKPQKPLFPRIK